ncbi:MAG: class I SAM-dependent methyltransferase [Steroidobacteraceae bacterium]|jgi:methyltransferase-like protein/predicted O-methyltransferase YrrM|nr:class I SAM-dependent methyltransferase [Steroidobacteraceae bacterium]
MSAHDYDAIPYASRAFPQSQPEQLAVMGRLFGLAPRLPSEARVLELGCSAGGNLLPLAARYPRARFLGIDYSPVQVQRGQQRVRELGLGNVEIRQQGIAEFGRDAGPFDYVVCHGVYSWVAPEVQGAILAVCRDNLSPDGIAYVSYNTYPGWKMREVVRDAMLFHTRGLQDPRDRIAQARAMVRFTKDITDPASAFGRMLADEAGLVEKAEDFYLFHEHLEAYNRPCYFREFVEAAGAHGLGYLGEAALADMAPQRLGPKVHEALQKVSGGNIIATEQYMDFFRNRSFRQTLLVHGERMAAVRRTITPQTHRGFLLTCAFVPIAAVRPEGAEAAEFRDPSGRSIRATAPLLKAFLLELAMRFPRPAAYDELLAGATALLAGRLVVGDADVAALDAALMRFLLEGLLRLHLEPIPVGSAGDARPRSFAPARAAVLQREEVVATLRHDTVRLDGVDSRVLRLLDGELDREGLCDALLQAAVRGEITVRSGDAAVVDPEVLGVAVGRLLDESLRRFERLALLAA